MERLSEEGQVRIKDGEKGLLTGSYGENKQDEWFNNIIPDITPFNIGLKKDPFI